MNAMEILFFACLIVTYAAIWQVISKAGFSAWWNVLPISWLAILVIGREILAHSQFGSLGSLFNFTENFFLFFVADSLVNWLFFLLFAFISWPVMSAPVRRTRDEHPPRWPSPVKHPEDSKLAARVVAPRDVPPAQSSDDLTPLGSEGAVKTETLVRQPVKSSVFCAWCGMERALDAIAIHYCGSKSRPALHCVSCGAPFVNGTTQCTSCGPPSSEHS